MPLHECAQQIDPICRRQLTLHFRADAGLVATVHQQRARRQRDLGPSHRRRWTGGTGSGQDLSQQFAGGDEVEVGRDVGSSIEDRFCDQVRHRNLAIDQVAAVALGVLGQRPERSSSKDPEMSGQHHIGVGRVESVAVDKIGSERAQPIFEPCGDQPLVHTRLEIRHRASLGSSRNRSRDSRSLAARAACEGSLPPE